MNRIKDCPVLEADINIVTEIWSPDDAYLKDYDFSNKDRLDSEIVISRARRDEYISGGIISFESLRDGESNSTLPTIVLDSLYERRFFPTQTGGELRLSANVNARRPSAVDKNGRLPLKLLVIRLEVYSTPVAVADKPTVLEMEVRRMEILTPATLEARVLVAVP